MMKKVLTYNTVKYVHIQDVRLASLRYFFLVAILVYVLVFEMYFFGGYLQPNPVVGVVRFSLKHPTIDNCDPYTSNTSNDCFNAFDPLDTLPYCAQNPDSESYVGSKYPCEIYESTNAQLVSEKSIAVITRASVRNQTLTCASNDMTCPRTYTDKLISMEMEDNNKFYVAQSEEFTIMMDHAVSSKEFTARAADYTGRLMSSSDDLCHREFAKGNSFASCQGEKLLDSAPCYIKPQQTGTKQDFFTLDDLLAAASVHIDDCSDGHGHGTSNHTSSISSCQTYRDSGATVFLNIYWTDFHKYKGKVEPHYYYSPQVITGSSFKQTIPFYNQYRESRTLMNAHAIKVAVLIGGEFHQFNSVNFLMTLTTALGLLAIATTIVDNFMLFGPKRQHYQQIKYERAGEAPQSHNEHQHEQTENNDESLERSFDSENNRESESLLLANEEQQLSGNLNEPFL
mmetsp:Transcript_21604/g.24583  ORF Transcript_21604/g.24583 Transcript_21604/m.24583 type:complete len:455 (+) Transcript_21604:183-1547(+)